MSKINNSQLGLYNKYRPSSFADLKGQDHIVTYCENKIKDNDLPHFLIFYGPPGTGKTSSARIVANMLNSSPYGVIEKDSALNGGKDEIRQLQSDIYNRPIEGEYKTYIYDEAHEITKAAFSSLLKVTEEPPPHIKFIFITTEFNKIPNNIKSRAQSFCFKRISSKLITERLEEILKLEDKTLPEPLVKLAVQIGNGSLRNAIVSLETILTSHELKKTEEEIANSLGVIGSKVLAEFVGSYLFKDFNKMYSNVQFFYEDTTDTFKALEELQQFITDCRYCLIIPDMVSDVITDVSYFFQITNILKKNNEDKAYLGRRLSLMYNMSVILEKDIKFITNKKAALDMFVVKLAETWSTDG